MEKIVTKIGDVTIERRVSKPKGPMENTFRNNGQESSQPLPDFSSGSSKSTDLDDDAWRPEITITNKNSNRTFTIAGHQEITLEGSPKRLTVSNNQIFGCSFSSEEPPEKLHSDLECVSNESQNPTVLETSESGVSLPKVSRITPVISDVGKNEPDLSKLVGISIERKRRIDFESQTSQALSEDKLTKHNNNISSSADVPKINHDESVILSDDTTKRDTSEQNILPESNIKLECGYPERELEDLCKNQSNDTSDLPFIGEELAKPGPHDVIVEHDLERIKKEDGADEEEEEEKMGCVFDEDAEQISNEEDREETESVAEVKGTDMNDFDLVELMQKGEIEGEIEDVKNEDIDEESDEQKLGKRKGNEEGDEDNADEEDNGEDVGESKDTKPPKKKKKKSEAKEGEDKKEGTEGEGEDKNIDKSKVTNASLRKNIREVMDETKLDEATLSAQRQEAERLKRLQEQQRIIREVQRQIALNRQNQKSQNKVLSLLQGNSQTSILKTSSTATQVQNAQTKTQNSVLVKLSNGEQTSLNNKKMIELLKNSKNKTILGKPPIPKTLFKQGMVTPSVSIAPVIKKDPVVVDDKKKKKGDVVTLSSDSEDDCIVLSDEDESEPEEDPTNSGMHTNDKYNLPDEQGRVLVNVGHPEAESDLYLAPQIAKIIKPHQIGGIRFLYDNVIESIDRFSTSAGFGCILAHSMGLGKTLQIVSFSDIFLRYTSAKTILCIMPINTIQNWLAEFNMWLPKDSTSEEVRCREFDLFIVNESLKNINARAKVILDWKKSGGVLLMGYELFRLLSLKKSYKSKKKRKRDIEEDDAKNKELIEEVYSALVVPGPDLVICDEGHRIKNSHATTSQALKQIRTKRRIVLTGYPLQNNLLEYWCMVDFVRPNYLGTKTEFSNMFERPIQNGQCIDSTPQDKRLMRYRAHVLHSLLEGFVQRRSHAVLQSTLPDKEEYVLLLRFTPFQRKLYDTFMNEVVRTVAVPNPLKAFAVCCKIWNHPDVLYNFLKKKGEEIDLDLEEALPPSLQIPQYPYGQQSVGLDGTNQQLLAWPRRGPGSRGGKSRQNNARNKGQNQRGRKPAASISPSLSTSGSQKITPEGGYGSGQYPGSGDFPSKNFPGQTETNLNNFQGRNYTGSQFGYGNEYNGQQGYGSSNFNKSSLNNLEEMSTGNFQGKRFFSPNNEARNQVHGYGTDGRYSQPVGTESTINPSFDSNLNSADSAFRQSDSSKGFNYSQEFNSEFYSSRSFQSSGPMANYQRETKPPVYSNNPYYQNPNFRSTGNFEYSSGSAINPSFSGYDRQTSNFPNPAPQNPSFQAPIQGSGGNQRGTAAAAAGGSGQVTSFPPQNIPGNFQDSGSTSGSSFPGNFAGSNANFEENRFSGQPGNSSNFQGNGGNFNKNFPGSNGSNFEMNRNGKGGNFQRQNPNFPSGSNYADQNYWSQSNWSYGESSKGNQDYRGSSAPNEFMPQQKFNSFDEGQETAKPDTKTFSSGNNNSAMYTKINCDYSTSSFEKAETESKATAAEFENEEGNKPKDEEEKKDEAGKNTEVVKKEDTSLPYDWAIDLFKNYVTGVIENSSKMEVFIHIVTESIKLGDRLLVFSQSLLTLDLIENYLHKQNVPGKDEVWAKARNYFRLDGSTPGLEREKLINEFNSNGNIHLFLVSTRAGSLGINLVGANRVVVFDASWNPCHDTQAVCRVYRYGQQKPCYVYRLVMDSCLEKKIYDRQVNKQGMADRVVDELNPDAHLSIKEVTNLCWDDQEDTTVKDYSDLKDKYSDEIIKILLERCSKVLSKEPFHHESLLIDRKEKKLSQAEKRLAKRSYELEKQAANQPKNMYTFFPNAGQRNFVKPIASVRPMQSEMNTRMSPQMQNRTKWIPADVWQKQGMSAQEMTLPLDVVIPTSSPEKTSIVLKAGQRVMVLKSPKGIYMQLENGKIIAIRSAFKVGQNSSGGGDKHEDVKKGCTHMTSMSKSTGSITVTPKMAQNIRHGIVKQPFTKPFAKYTERKVTPNTNMVKGRQVMGKAKPFVLNRKLENVGADVKQRLMTSDKSGLNVQDEKFDSGEPTIIEEKLNVPEKADSSVEDGSFTDEAVISSSDEKTDEKAEDKCGMTDSLETLRKVTEKISDSAKREPSEPQTEIQYRQSGQLKNYRHNFASQVKESPTVVEEKVADIVNPMGVTSGGTGTTASRISSGIRGSVNRTSASVGLAVSRTHASGNTGGNAVTTTDARKEEKVDMANTASSSTSVHQQGSENIQNWLTNQSYPPADPYGNYFPGYYAYGAGPVGPMVPPYEGLYPSNNYSHSLGRTSSVQAPNPKTQAPEPSKTTSQPVQPVVNPIPQTVQTSTPSRNPAPVVGSSPMYPAYPNPYSYPYNYPTNPNFNSQGFSISNQTQSSQQTTQSEGTGTGGNSGQTQPGSSYSDSSMYSAFHRPDTTPFQSPDNPYQSPYPRTPNPPTGTGPSFFPYNPPYPNYPYGANFNPYMHPTGYGYHPSTGQGVGGSNASAGSGGSAIGGSNNSAIPHNS